MAIVAALDDPAFGAAANDDADMMAPHDNDAFGGARSRHAIASPPARKISGAVGNAEMVPHPPAAPGARTAVRLMVRTRKRLGMSHAPCGQKAERKRGGKKPRHEQTSPRAGRF